MSLDETRSGNEIFGSLGAVQLSKCRSSFFLITWITTKRSEGIGRKCDEICHGETACNVADVRVQAAVLVNDDDRRQLPFGVGRLDEVATCLCVALRRRI